MGLPEIVDAARNFAVMVRVQGPDPKGVKMRKHAFHHYNSGKTTISASGMFLPGSFPIVSMGRQVLGEDDTDLPGTALVVTVASVLEPFLSLQQRENISQAKPELIPGVCIDIMVEGKMGEDHIEVSDLDKLPPRWLPARLLKMVDIPTSSSALQSLVEASSGSVEHGWEVGWSLTSYSNGPHPFKDAVRNQANQSQVPRGESRNPIHFGKSNTRIAILGVSSIACKDLPHLNESPSDKRGDLLLAMGSPFGILSPQHFFNSISVGSISNCYPSSSSATSLLIADIRCLPGMEGGPVLGEQAQLIGILTKPLRQMTGGAEIQLVIPWKAIATACSDLLQEEPQNAWKRIDRNNGNLNSVGTSLSKSLELDGSVNHIHEHQNSVCAPSLAVERAMASICLITIDDGVWASGILLNNRGLILTNAHLLEPWRFGRSASCGEIYKIKSEVLPQPSNGSVPTDLSLGGKLGRHNFNSSTSLRSIRVRLDHTDPWMWHDAKVVYVSKGSLDVALLQLQFVPHQLHPISVDFRCPSQGSKVYVIGHGLFGPRCDSLPSACTGVVAKVVEAKRDPTYQSRLQEKAHGYFPAMLETTAAVHPGGSGGAVVNSVGHMIGLVTSNARHGGGTVIPHLNFSIPCAALESIFKFSEDMRDLSPLQDLDKPNENLSAAWALIPPLSPKPGPSLPNLRESLPGDNKHGKGSRFAKFIAERHEIFKKMTQLGASESRSTEFIPSKL